MRGIYKTLTSIRRKVFVEVAKLAYEDNDYSRIESLPYKIIPGEVATYRDSIFLERAIVGERIRLAMGLSLRPIDKPEPISKDIEDSIKAEKYYEPPLINIIKFACNACKEKGYEVSNGCRGCLAHPCREICPKQAISFVNGKAYIDQDKCIKCGMCKNVCPYDAILKHERPCAAACGMDAIKSDEHGFAQIDHDKCVSCGMCLVSCPFGAIADKSQIFQLIQAIKEKDEVIAVVAPAFIGQFGPNVTPSKLKAGFKELGISDSVEVAIGADLCTIQEAEDFVDNVPSKIPWMATSCCPAWSMMAKKLYPDHKDNISMALTPMVLTARLVKRAHPNAKIVFIGPCAAKKLEASRKSIRSEVDFVLTFEETLAMFEAKEIDFDKLEVEEEASHASEDGNGFAVSGGVANAVVNCIHASNPEQEVKVQSAQGLKECRKLLNDATKGKYDGYLLEGMACPGGCVAGAGTLQPIPKATASVNKFKRNTPLKRSNESNYKDNLDLLTKDYNK
ncbi:MAG: 4Fe-4S dicluster domain-containing protein [Thomasclavelia sp.]|nr:4Fe-4S dicluster domain-containing protein [Thomasclavelia sp.]